MNKIQFLNIQVHRHRHSNSKLTHKGFTLLEVLVSLSILVLTLMALYQSFSISIFVLSSTTNLWKAMTHAQNELLKSERATTSPPVSLSQGEFEIDHPMNGWLTPKLDSRPPLERDWIVVLGLRQWRHIEGWSLLDASRLQSPNERSIWM